ncbi:patatin-like protein [Frankia gtarii]|uniref:patatin-like protein n=1 Tax=Frankia gtarii TaxID=2950102 RepID=UPI0021C1A049|nr:patatin-like protein [Frankia gtarii]
MNFNRNPSRVDHGDLEDIRLAVVLNGGVSLAVWMAGVVNEINGLVQSGAAGSLRGQPDTSAAESSTVYKELLGLVGATARADVIAGTSAGGINGAFLAYAQAYGADLRGLGRQWADLGSFDALLRRPEPAPESLLRGDDYFLRELAQIFDDLVPEDERWLRYVPADQRPIDLIINTTLIHGQPKHYLDDFGTTITESVHTGRLRFTRAAGKPALDPFAKKIVARQLALASRSTASFPVAFEPSFVPVGEDGKDEYHPDMGATAELPPIATFPQSRYVIDGGVLLNQPVKPALAAIYAQPADRQVRRLLIHVNPDPRSALPSEVAGLVGPGADSADAPPRLARVLETLALLPYAQSVDAELAEIRDTNDRVRRYRSERPGVIGVLNEELAGKLLAEYRTLRSHREADRINALLAAAPDQHRRWWTHADLATALHDSGLGAVSYVPTDLPADADPAQWDWGIEPVERIGAVAVDIFKRAVWLAKPTDTDLRGRLRRYRWRLHAALTLLRDIRSDDEQFWRDQADQPPPQPPEASDASQRQEQLHVWLQEALSRWPLPPGAKQAPAATLPNRLGDVAKRIAEVLIDAREDLHRVTKRQDDGGVASTVPNATYESELLDKLLEALLPDGQQVSPTSLLRRLLAVEVCQLTIAGAPPEVEQEVTLQQVSGFTPNSFGGPSTPDKIAGIKLFWFGGFLAKSWRVNDWIWGRLDGATRMVQAVLDPARMRQLGLSSKDTHDQLRRLAVGGEYQDDLGALFDADSEQILAELAFLDTADGDIATTDSLRTTVLAITRRLHAEILAEELPLLARAVAEDLDHVGDDGSPAKHFLDAWEKRSKPPTLHQLFTIFSQAEIAREPVTSAVEDLLERSTKLSLLLVVNLTRNLARDLAEGLADLHPPTPSLFQALLLVGEVGIQKILEPTFRTAITPLRFAKKGAAKIWDSL